MRSTLPVVALAAALALPAVAPAEPVHHATAWFAEMLGLSPDALPASLPVHEASFGPEGVRSAVRDVPMAELAGRARAMVDGSGPPGLPAIPSYAGLGVRQSATDPGMGWGGFAFGNKDMACIEVDHVATPFLLPPSPVGPGGPLSFNLHGELPGSNFFIRSGWAWMDAQLFPTPGATGPAASVAALQGNALAQSGTMWHICYIVFTSKVSLAGFAGDGLVHG